MSIVIPRHAKKQMEARGISEADVLEALEHGELIFEERNHRLGLKCYMKLRMKFEDMIVVWFYNRNKEMEVITVYWRKRGGWYG